MGRYRENFEFVLDNEFVVAGFSTRFAGNLATHVGDDALNVEQNRLNLCNLLNLKELKFMQQTHSDIVKVLRDDSDDVGICDSVVTNLKDIGICVMVADCSPILLFDKKRLVVAAIHAGRAGVLSKILSKSIAVMKDEFLSDVCDISAFVGANIKGSCYEIEGLCLGEFDKFKKDNKFDMNEALKDEFLSLGLRDFKFSQVCTHCDDRYFSYRRDKVTGRFAGVIALRR